MPFAFSAEPPPLEKVANVASHNIDLSAPARIDALIQRMRKGGVPISQIERDDLAQIAEAHSVVTEFGTCRIVTSSPVGTVTGSAIPVPAVPGNWIRFGALADTHYGSIFERTDIVDSLYDLYEREGIQMVFHGGNMIEGEAGFNQYQIHVHGCDNQIEYFAEKYPKKSGITTWMVVGDDHEGWYMQKRGTNVGPWIEKLRPDIKYAGYQFADFILGNGAKLRLEHAGGGSSYAVSYTSQKMIEAYSEADRPDILLIGHFHKSEYVEWLGTHAFQLASTKEQDHFMHKKRLKSVLGGWIIEVLLDDDGKVRRVRQEFFPFTARPKSITPLRASTQHPASI